MYHGYFIGFRNPKSRIFCVDFRDLCREILNYNPALNEKGILYIQKVVQPVNQLEGTQRDQKWMDASVAAVTTLARDPL